STGNCRTPRTTRDRRLGCRRRRGPPQALTPNLGGRPRPMTPEQKQIDQDTFAAGEPIAETAAALFYGRLFDLDPSLRPMFRGDIGEQGRKLMQTLAVVVHGLDRLASLVPAIE